MGGSETCNPNGGSSPWMRGAPQVGFSVFMRRIKWQIPPTDFRLPECTLPRPPPPKQLESSAMPGNHGFRLYKDQGVGPVRPYSTEDNPEQPIRTMQSRTRVLSLQYGELLAKSRDLQSEFMARPKEGAEVGDHGEDEHSHPSDLT